MFKYIKILLFLFLIFYINNQSAKEILIYADSISYDSDKNLIAKGNAKVLSGNQILTSQLIIYNSKNKKFTLPIEFKFKDEIGVFYNGSSAKFSKDLESAEINDVKLLFSDGSRVVGKSAIRKKSVDIITKGIYTPCTSRINFKKFSPIDKLCPIWQMEGEKIIHDSESLLLYQKHSKMRFFNLPIFYLPYLASPSPLRKKRKSGFLIPNASFNFLNTKVEQSISIPYYFNLDIDKELTFTPIFKYGGGVNSSQRFLADYNQLISGGELNFDLTLDTKLENRNNESWIKDASLITTYNKNLNEKYKIDISSAFQSSKSYIQNVTPNNDISYKTSLATKLNLNGFNLNNKNDELHMNVSTYQVAQYKIDNANVPTVLPYVKYKSGIKNKKNYEYENTYYFYNIFRDTGTTDHSKMQQKIEFQNDLGKEIILYKSKFNFKSEIHNQYFYTRNKKINDLEYNTEYIKIFPMFGIFAETPFRHKHKSIYITPKASLIVNSSQSNNGKLSNEESTNNSFSIDTHDDLNRYSGTDKLDNSKRINYSLSIQNDKLELEFSQLYEFSNNNNYHKEMGNNDKLSDLLSRITYLKGDKSMIYNLRYDVDLDKIRNQSITYNSDNKFGEVELTYLDEKKETNNILSGGNEYLNYYYKSNKLGKYSKVSLEGKYDLLKDQHNEYNVGYSYFDECFGININFSRKYYSAVNILPSDTLTLMFSFKNLGSYKSSNLAVSETDKQDIEWQTESAMDEEFN